MSISINLVRILRKLCAKIALKRSGLQDIILMLLSMTSLAKKHKMDVKSVK